MLVLTPSNFSISNASYISNSNIPTTAYSWVADFNYYASTSDSPVIVEYNGNWYESLQSVNYNKIPNQNPTWWKYISPALLPALVPTQFAYNQAYPINTIMANPYTGTDFYKAIQDNVIFEVASGGTKVYLDTTKWQNIGLSNQLRQFDNSQTTATIGHYNIKYRIEVPHEFNSSMKALAITNIKNAETVSLEVNPDPNLSSYLSTNIVKIKNAVDIDTIWCGEQYDTVNRVGLPPSASYYITQDKKPAACIDENIESSCDIETTSQNTSKKIPITIKFNKKVRIKKVNFITSEDSTQFDPIHLYITGSNSANGFSQTVLWGNPDGHIDVTQHTSPNFPSLRNVETPDLNLDIGTNQFLYYTFYFKASSSFRLRIAEINLYYDTVTDPIELWKYTNFVDQPLTTIEYLPNRTYIPLNINGYGGYIHIDQITTTGSEPVNSSEGANNLFDADTGTKWYEEMLPIFTGYAERKSVSIVVKLHYIWCIQKVQFVTSNDYPGRDPKSFAIYGSLDGIEWTLLKEELNLNLPETRSAESSIIPINNMEAYQYYKITFYDSKINPSLAPGGKAYEYQLSELRLLFDINDETGYALRSYNQFTSANVLGTSVITNTNRLVLAEVQATSKIYYMDGDFTNSANLRTTTINGVPGSAQLLINRLYHHKPSNKLFAVGGDLAVQKGYILISQDNGVTWTSVDLDWASISPIWDLTYCGGSINKFVAIGYNNEVLVSTDGINWNFQNPGGYISTNLWGAFFTKIEWTDRYGGMLYLPGVVYSAEYGNRPGIIWTSDLVNFGSYQLTTQPWYNMLTCSSYRIFYGSEETDIIAAGGTECAVVGLRSSSNPNQHFIYDISSTIFDSSLEMVDGFINDIKPLYNQPTGWLVCGSGYTAPDPFGQTYAAGKIFKLYDEYGGALATLVHKDTKFRPYPITSLTYYETNKEYIATLRQSILINRPAYFNSKILVNGDSVKSSAVFDVGLYDKLAEYDKLYYTIQITGKQNIQIANTKLFERAISLGNTQRGANLSIIDYSIKNIDDFGNISVIERASSNRINVNVLINVKDINTIQKELNNLRASICLWVGSTELDYEGLILYGFYRNYSIDINNPELATLTLELESLAQ